MKKILTKTANFFLTKTNMNPAVLEAEYAVRGVVPLKAAEIEAEIKSNPNHKFPFKEMTYCNIGNPQNFNQKPISYNRIIISCLLNP
jgi:alanine transaminase